MCVFSNRMCKNRELNFTGNPCSKWCDRSTALLCGTKIHRTNESCICNSGVFAVRVSFEHCNFCPLVIPFGRFPHSLLSRHTNANKTKNHHFSKNCSPSQMLHFPLYVCTNTQTRKMYAQSFNALCARCFWHGYMGDHRTFGPSVLASVCRVVQMQSSYKLHFALFFFIFLAMNCKSPCKSLLVYLKYKSNHTSDFIVAGLAREIKDEKKTIKRNRILQSFWFLGRSKQRVRIHIFFSLFSLGAARIPMIPFRLCSTIKVSYGEKFCSLHFVQTKSNSNTYGETICATQNRSVGREKAKRKRVRNALPSVSAKAVQTFQRNLSISHRCIELSVYRKSMCSVYTRSRAKGKTPLSV